MKYHKPTNRLERLICGETYHIYNKTVGGELLFRTDIDYGFFLKKMERFILPVAAIYAYCLLPNHFHIMLKIKEEQDILPLRKIDDETGEVLKQIAIEIRRSYEKDNEYNSVENIEIVKSREVEVEIEQEKDKFKFESKYLELLWIMFTDIEGYTRKSQELSSIELNKLIQEYEDILIPIVNKHRGNLIKRIGDGHLFVFKNPLDSVLAAIRLQKALKRFNMYREEWLRISVRVGIHGGRVIRKEGDVFGNPVNIASRLESNARGGKIFISDYLFNEVKEWIHANFIGELELKGIEKPVPVYEPYEIVMNLPDGLDPLKMKINDNVKIDKNLEQKYDNKENDKIMREEVKYKEINKRLVQFIKNSFLIFNRLCIEVEQGKSDVSELRKEVLKRWNVLKHYINSRS